MWNDFSLSLPHIQTHVSIIQGAVMWLHANHKRSQGITFGGMLLRHLILSLLDGCLYFLNKMELLYHSTISMIMQNLVEKIKITHSRLPNKADMFWKILSSSGVMAGLFSKVTNLWDEGSGMEESEKWKEKNIHTEWEQNRELGELGKKGNTEDVDQGWQRKMGRKI